REEVEGDGAAHRIGGEELLRYPSKEIEMGGVLKAEIRKQKAEVFVVAISAFCLLLSAFSCTMPHPDGTIYTARTIAAGAAQTPRHDAGVFVRDGKIVAVDALASLRAAHPSARVVDYGDATILPGLTDAHGHLYGLGLSLDTVPLVAASVEE